jgi:hypothetical protein
MLAVGSQQILNLWCCFCLHISRRLSADTLSLPPTKRVCCDAHIKVVVYGCSFKSFKGCNLKYSHMKEYSAATLYALGVTRVQAKSLLVCISNQTKR